MTTSTVLSTTQTATLNAEGAATVSFVCKPAERWLLKQVVVSTTSTVNSSKAFVFSNNQELCGSNSGNSDAADGDIQLPVGVTVQVGWTGGDAGAQATATIYYSLFL
jgi:hypothetical protein